MHVRGTWGEPTSWLGGFDLRAPETPQEVQEMFRRFGYIFQYLDHIWIYILYLQIPNFDFEARAFDHGSPGVGKCPILGILDITL